MRKRLWMGVGLACLLMGAGATKTNLGLGPIAGRTWNGWAKLKSGDLVTISLVMQPNGRTVGLSYADFVVTRDGDTTRYRGWLGFADETTYSSSKGNIVFKIVGERDVEISSKNREAEYRRDRKMLEEKSLGVFKLSYKIRTDYEDPVGALTGTSTGFVEGHVGLITFDPRPKIKFPEDGR
ncbi:MAG: hypothetical protein O7H41_15375 [Planctomycetota bacterium]|nr:hypothetical protein [Planctomycetota bacterium]